MAILKNFLVAYLSIGLQLVDISHQQSCILWTANPGFHSLNGVHYSTYNTLDACKDKCIRTPNCALIDFDANPNPDFTGCWINTSPSRLSQYASNTQYTLDRNCFLSAKSPLNVALGKETFQSSSWDYGHPKHAVDGNRDATYYHVSCSHTDTGTLIQQVPAWWAVDLVNQYRVYRVIITNRGDCCPERLRDFSIGMTDISPAVRPISLLNTADEGKIIGQYVGSPPAGIPTNVTCNCDAHKAGRFLFIQQTNYEPLTICELEVNAMLVVTATG